MRRADVIICEDYISVQKVVPESTTVVDVLSIIVADLIADLNLDPAFDHRHDLR